MRPPKYPLAPLADLREKRVEEAVCGLAAATRECDAAVRKRQASEHERQAHAESAATVRCSEAAALARGELRVAHLAHAVAWEARVQAERVAITAEIDRANTEEASARATEGRALDEVALRKAEAQAVEKDRAKWVGAQRRKAEARDEEASSETWRPSKA